MRFLTYSIKNQVLTSNALKPMRIKTLANVKKLRYVALPYKLKHGIEMINVGIHSHQY